MTLPAALNIVLWALIVLGTGIYLVLRLWEHHATGGHGLIASHVILGRLTLLLLALGGAGVLGILIGPNEVDLFRFGGAVIRGAGLAAVWTLVVFDIQRIRQQA